LPGLRREESPPKLTTTHLIEHARSIAQSVEPFTVKAATGSTTYRAVAIKAPDGRTVVVATSMTDMLATFRRILVVEAFATLLVLLALGAVMLWVLRLGVKPLTEMAVTAETIAAGNLSTRISVTNDRTEAGRLGVALNEMLHQIERAFNERAESEGRLRRFVADASHELRTPLTSIRGYTELYRQGGLRDESDRNEAMRRMEQEAKRMAVLVDDLLLLARLDERRDLQRAPVDLTPLVEDAVRDARAVEPARPIDLEAVPQLWVNGDEHRLRQVVANLLTNTRVHTPPGTPVHVRLQRENGHAIVEVADEGPGLGPDSAHRVFERFYRADAGRARANGGSGLGLAIVAAVADAHGGRAMVTSSPGRGAAFRVELPVPGGP
jgi:two-component system OmpR family sensor kinase